MHMYAERYVPELCCEWNQFVAMARNTSFLFHRDYMDYHRDRYRDASLLFRNEKGKLRGLLPANLRSEDGMVESHGGLTYGGFILHPAASALEVGEMLRCALAIYSEIPSLKRLAYKPVPHIYHTTPSEEPLYWLHRYGARLCARTLSTTIHIPSPLSFSTLRKRKLQKSKGLNLRVHDNRLEHLPSFWSILASILYAYHNTAPVHTLDEMQLLMSRFPHQIKLATVTHDNTPVAGCILYENLPQVVHVQYIAASNAGRETGALDLLFEHLIQHYKTAGCRYFDFGISTEEGGRVLNEGLLFQKEGFGGRGVCYDTYEIELTNA